MIEFYETMVVNVFPRQVINFMIVCSLYLTCSDEAIKQQAGYNSCHYPPLEQDSNSDLGFYMKICLVYR